MFLSDTMAIVRLIAWFVLFWLFAHRLTGRYQHRSSRPKISLAILLVATPFLLWLNAAALLEGPVLLVFAVLVAIWRGTGGKKAAVGSVLSRLEERVLDFVEALERDPAHAKTIANDAARRRKQRTKRRLFSVSFGLPLLFGATAGGLTSLQRRFLLTDEQAVQIVDPNHLHDVAAYLPSGLLTLLKTMARVEWIDLAFLLPASAAVLLPFVLFRLALSVQPQRKAAAIAACVGTTVWLGTFSMSPPAPFTIAMAFVGLLAMAATVFSHRTGPLVGCLALSLCGPHALLVGVILLVSLRRPVSRRAIAARGATAILAAGIVAAPHLLVGESLGRAFDQVFQQLTAQTPALWNADVLAVAAVVSLVLCHAGAGQHRRHGGFIQVAFAGLLVANVLPPFLQVLLTLCVSTTCVVHVLHCFRCSVQQAKLTEDARAQWQQSKSIRRLAWIPAALAVGVWFLPSSPFAAADVPLTEEEAVRATRYRDAFVPGTWTLVGPESFQAYVKGRGFMMSPEEFLRRYRPHTYVFSPKETALSIPTQTVLIELGPSLDQRQKMKMYAWLEAFSQRAEEDRTHLLELQSDVARLTLPKEVERELVIQHRQKTNARPHQ